LNPITTLTINCVTRGRPDLLVPSVIATLSNVWRTGTRIVVSADEDDQSTLDAIPQLPEHPAIVIDVRPREDSLGAKYNRIQDYPADVYLPMNDSAAYMTPGFDQLILESAQKFPDGIGMVCGDMHCYMFPGVMASTHGFVEKLGWFYPPYFPYWFHDHWVYDVATLIDRVSWVDVRYSRHAGKGQTRELRDIQFWTTLFDCARLVRRRQSHAIINSPDFIEAGWRKELLLSHHPITEFRSQWANAGMRGEPAIAAMTAAGDGGERYQRLKAEALELMSQWAPDMLEELEKNAAKEAA